MLRVKDIKTLRKLKENNKINELALVEDTRVMYKWDGSNWQSYVSPKGVNTTLYEINQAAITGLPECSEEELSAKTDEFTKWREETNKQYYMLLSNDERYYTMFVTRQYHKLPFGVEVMDCLKSRGQVKSIELLDNGSFECWITHDNDSHVYYLFPYEEGVIECQ